MAMKPNAPSHTLEVESYDEFRKLVLAHAQEHYDLTAIVGRGGIGKSQIVRRTINSHHGGQGWGLIKGKHSPLDLYGRLYRCLHRTSDRGVGFTPLVRQAHEQDNAKRPSPPSITRLRFSVLGLA